MKLKTVDNLKRVVDTMMVDIWTGSFDPNFFEKFRDYHVNLIVQHAQFIGIWWTKNPKKVFKEFAGGKLFGV